MLVDRVALAAVLPGEGHPAGGAGELTPAGANNTPATAGAAAEFDDAADRQVRRQREWRRGRSHAPRGGRRLVERLSVGLNVILKVYCVQETLEAVRAVVIFKVGLRRQRGGP